MRPQITSNSSVMGRDYYRRLIVRRSLVLAALFLMLVLCFGLDLSFGPARYDLEEVAYAILFPQEASVQVSVVIWDIRMPIASTAIVVGAALSVAGAQMQTILNNPLASPFTLGISAAASFGAAIALAFGVAFVPVSQDFIVPVNAFIFAMLAALLIHFLSMGRGVNVQTIILLGIALVFSFNALLALVQYLASAEALAAVVFWTMGSLTKATWPKFFVICGLLVLIMPLFVRRAWALTAMRLGDEKATSFGIKVPRLRLEVLLLVSLLAAVPVAFVGTIGFVGLVGPHFARMLIGEDQRFFLPASALSGALLMSASSFASKAILPGAILPIGIVTSLVGIPFFIFLIMSSRKRAW